LYICGLSYAQFQYEDLKIQPTAKGFDANFTRSITIPIRRGDLCHWDETAETWMFEPGCIDIQVGGSSDQLPLKANVTLP